jgi:intracellular multiplication protein IcmV
MTESDQKQAQKKRGFFRGVMGTFFDVPRWVNVRQYVDTNKTIYAKVKDTFRIAEAQREETFEQAMQRLNVTEADLKERVKHNQRTLTILLVFIVFLCIYGFYLISQGVFAGTMLLLAVIFLTVVRAFQYSFWNFQIKSRKLGCSFQDWLNRNKLNKT